MYFSTIDGVNDKPMMGRLPVETRVYGPSMTSQQQGQVFRAYKAFFDACSTALGDYHVKDISFSDLRIRITRNFQRDVVQVWTIDSQDSYVYAYLESGQLEHGFPSLNVSANQACATWEFLDVPFAASSKWVGLVKVQSSGIAPISSTGAQAASQPTPIDSHKLRDRIDSRAVGYPRSADSVVDAAKKAEYGDATTLKKLTARLFNPSIFPGKLRLMVQAHYGAMETPTSFRYAPDIFGGSLTLNYSGLAGGSVQMCFWAHASSGLYTDAKFNYFFIDLRHSAGTGLITVTAYRLVLMPAGEALRKFLVNNFTALPDADKRKVEAYILADSYIDTSDPHIAGTYSVGATIGSTLCYGWKFNWNGSRASVVTTWTVGDIFTNNIDGRSMEIHLNIHRHPTAVSSDPAVASWKTGWLISGEQSEVYNWLDGWGDYNIHWPETEVSSVLISESHDFGFHAVDPYSYSNVPIYGYYRDQDYATNGTWTPVTVSKTINVKEVGDIDQLWEGIPEDGFDPSAHIHSATVNIKDHLGWRYDTDMRWEKHVYTAGCYDMDVSIDGAITHGTFRAYSLDYMYNVYVGAESGTVTYYFAFQHNGTLSGVSADYDAMEAERATWYSDNPDNDYNTISLVARELWAGHTDSVDVAKWALVITPGDCEAVHVAQRTIRNNTTHNTITHATYTALGEQNFYAWRIDDPYTSYYHHFVLRDTFHSPGEVAINLATDYTGIPPDADVEYFVNLFSKSRTNISGTPSTSYWTLMYVSQLDPYFNGMIVYSESLGGRYTSTEFGDSHPDADFVHYFVGWA